MDGPEPALREDLVWLEDQTRTPVANGRLGTWREGLLDEWPSLIFKAGNDPSPVKVW